MSESSKDQADHTGGLHRDAGLQWYAASLAMMQQNLAAGIRLSEQMRHQAIDGLKHQAALAAKAADQAQANLATLVGKSEGASALHEEMVQLRNQTERSISALRQMADDARAHFFETIESVADLAARAEPSAGKQATGASTPVQTTAIPARPKPDPEPQRNAAAAKTSASAN